MKARWLYLLMLTPLCMMASAFAAMALTAGLAGILWLFVYGDDTWPAFVEPLLLTAGVGMFLVFWIALAWGSYCWGKRMETQGGLKRLHIIWVSALSIALPALVILRELSHQTFYLP